MLFSFWAQRIVVRQRAGFGVTVLPVHRIERQPAQLWLKPELSQHPNCVRALLDAGPDPRKCTRLLVDMNSHTDPQECGRSSKSPNPRANDRDFQFFLRQGSRPGKYCRQNVRTEDSDSQDRLHCCKTVRSTGSTQRFLASHQCLLALEPAFETNRFQLRTSRGGVPGRFLHQKPLRDLVEECRRWRG